MLCKIYFFVYSFVYKGSLDFGIPGVLVKSDKSSHNIIVGKKFPQMIEL